jgi:hypothetical protein
MVMTDVESGERKSQDVHEKVKDQLEMGYLKGNLSPWKDSTFTKEFNMYDSSKLIAELVKRNNNLATGVADALGKSLDETRAWAELQNYLMSYDESFSQQAKEYNKFVSDKINELGNFEKVDIGVVKDVDKAIADSGLKNIEFLSSYLTQRAYLIKEKIPGDWGQTQQALKSEAVGQKAVDMWEDTPEHDWARFARAAIEVSNMKDNFFSAQEVLKDVGARYFDTNSFFFMLRTNQEPAIVKASRDLVDAGEGKVLGNLKKAIEIEVSKVINNGKVSDPQALIYSVAKHILMYEELSGQSFDGKSGDMIVGFPGEDDQDFEQTLSLMEEVRYFDLFSFMYSSRPGTAAARWEDRLSRSVKQDRLDRLQRLQLEHSRAHNDSYLGTTQTVLVEGAAKYPDQVSGRADNGRIVNLPGPLSLVGSLVDVRITASYANSLLGEYQP